MCSLDRGARSVAHHLEGPVRRVIGLRRCLPGLDDFEEGGRVELHAETRRNQRALEQVEQGQHGSVIEGAGFS
jgi:hypothetical protein